MPSNISPLEEIDIITEIQSPDSVYSVDSQDEKMVFSKFINSLSEHRILLLNNDLFDYPFVVAGLTERHFEAILKDEKYEIKKLLINNLSDSEFLKQVAGFITEMDNRDKTTENSTRFKNVMQYLRDNRFIV